METTIDDLIGKVRAIAHGPNGELLRKFVDFLYEKEEYDHEPLSPEELEALKEAREAIRQGDMSQFISLEEFERKYGL
jgi:hypothetical protein